MKTLQPTLALVLTLATLTSFGQNSTGNSDVKRNTFFIEAGGNSFFYSLNYDHLLKVAEKWRLAGRVGAMYITSQFDNQTRNLLGFPIEFSYLRGSKANFFEVGFGITGLYDQYHINNPALPFRETNPSDLIVMSVLRIGYRHQKSEGGLFYKFGLTPLGGLVYNLKPNSGNKNHEKFAYPWLGAAIGWTMKR